MNINDKFEGSIYTAEEWTEFKNECQNFILSSGQALASNSLQHKQAAARYAANAASYNDSGIANAYSLTPIGLNDSPTAYIDGMNVSFKVGNENTGNSTIAVSGLAAKTLKKDGFTNNLQSGDLIAGKVYSAFYSLSDDAFEISTNPGLSAETVNKTLTISTGFTYSQIQAVYDSIGAYIRWDTIITVLWENGTYNIGANAIHITDYTGGGLLISQAINPTGSGTSVKNVTITGTGGQSYDDFPPYSDQTSQRYLIFLSGSGTFCFFGDLEMILTGTPTNRSAVIAGLRAGFSVVNCSVRSQVTTGVTANAVEAQFGAVVRVIGSYVEAKIGFAGIASCVTAGSTGQAHGVDLIGVGDYGYRADAGQVFRSGNGITASVALDLQSLGEVYS